MADVTPVDYRIANHFAKNCLLQCDWLIAAAKFDAKFCQSDNFLEADRDLHDSIQLFCDSLQSNRWQDRTRKVADHFIEIKPDFSLFEHSELIDTTAHALVWNFTWQVWSTMAGVVYAAWRQQNPESDLDCDTFDDVSFQLNAASVRENIDAIRDAILKVPRIDSQLLEKTLLLEYVKGLAAIKVNDVKGINSNTLIPPDTTDELDNAADKSKKKEYKRKMNKHAWACADEFKKDSADDEGLTLIDHVKSYAMTHNLNSATLYKRLSSNRDRWDE